MSKTNAGGGRNGRDAGSAGSEVERAYFNDSNIRVEGFNNQDVQDMVYTIFGRDLSREEIVSMVSPPDDSTVFLADEGDGTLSITVMKPGLIDDMVRHVYLDRNGKIEMHNDSFFLAMRDSGKVDANGSPIMVSVAKRGYGATTLARQVVALRNLGVQRITTFAAQGQDMVGYAVWPRLGFNAAIPSGKWPILARYGAAHGLDWSHVREYRDLMTSKAGRDAWEKIGWGIHDMSFSTSRSSQNSADLRAYILSSDGKVSDPGV